MKHKKIKKTIIFVIFWGMLIVSFVFFATLIILKANGYQLNWHYWKISQTSMIVLNGDPKDVDIKINQKYVTGFPEKLSNLSPGAYEVTVSRDGYYPWNKSFNLEPGKAAVAENIILFLKKAQDADVPSNIDANQIINEYQSNIDSLTIKENELYWQGKLLTRFASKILATSVYADNQHVVFQTNNEIRVIDLDGTNNTLLFNLSSFEPTAYTFRDNGQTIIYIDDGQLKAKTIR